MKHLCSALRRTLWTTGIACVAALPSVHAHPGHPLPEAGVVHLLTSPDHALFLAAVGALMCAGGLFVRAAASRRMLVRGGAAALLGAVAVWSLRA